ncbi:hypothetical protein LTR05_002156 [Lithohypha guttulata]|uniref:Uncharacterized protein n=1 Tax=Lithohypha guttulata TaxID=1690604 RepID=A0AAN7Y7V0_9EURO|nr:hypothetical protein LTR05_002156 [Lithohypha guttulata]
MSTSTDPEHFFQTSTSLAENDRKRRKAANTHGQPAKSRSKLLAISVDTFLDPSGSSALIAEADGNVSIFNLSINEFVRIGQNAPAPITCIQSYAGRTSIDNDSVSSFIFAGGWNKHITSFDITGLDFVNPTSPPQSTFKAHDDFLKCLLVAQAPDKKMVLLSGGADGVLNIWTFTGQRLASLKPQCRGIEDIALDPLSTHDAPRIFFSTSQREIFHFTLPASLRMAQTQLSQPIVQHETSVYKLEFDNDGDLWTASADKTAKRLNRENGFIADTTLVHPDFVRDIVVYDSSSLVITACRDEDIRVWNTGSGQLLHVFTGHFEEVTGLAIANHTLLSVSIDATIRRWSLAPQDLRKAVEEAKNPHLLAEEPEPKNDFSGLTEEEEAELRAMMEDEEADSLEKMAMNEQ